jgi:hypothetical protein
MEYAKNRMPLFELFFGKNKPLNGSPTSNRTMSKNMNDGQFLSNNRHFSSPRKRYLLLAAIPEEYTHFLNMAGPWQRVRTTPFSLLRSEKPRCTIYFTPTGMGIRKVAPFWQHILQCVKPDLVISFGFCGEIIRSTGEKLFVSGYFQPLPPSNFFKASEQPLSSSLLQFCRSNKMDIAATLSTPVFFHKRHIPHIISNYLSPARADQLLQCRLIVDMESALIASLAVEASLPFLSIRASTDAHDEEIPFDVEALLDDEGFVSVRRATALLSLNPPLTISFLRFWKSSKEASRRLADILTKLIALPPSVLELRSPRFCENH